MAWNTSATRFYSEDLAGLECGSYLKIPRRDRKITKIARYTGDLEIGQCVAMVRVPAGARITGTKLAWARGATSYLAVGDPYACGRLLGPVGTYRNSGVIGGLEGCTQFDCGTLAKTGRVGDGCGLFYQYTCETDIFITNLYSEGNANSGGWAGGTETANGPLRPGGKWTGGTPTLVLEVEYLQSS